MKTDVDDIVAPERGIALGDNSFPREFAGAEPYRWADTHAELVIKASGDVLLAQDIEPGPAMEGEPLPLGKCGMPREQFSRAPSSTACRSIATVAVHLTQASVFLHTDYGGAKIASDLRILNFRVFRCDLVTGKAAAATPARTTASPIARLRRTLGVFSKAFFSTADIRIPMSKARLEHLNLRKDESAVAFTLGPLLRAMPDADDVITGGLTAIWDAGWYDFERVRGETFRWMGYQGTITLILPESSGSRISLLVEAGPAVGFHGARLEIRDDADQVLAAADLRGRTTVDVPAAGLKGCAVLHLQVSGGAGPKLVKGDPRTLALRLIRCEFTPAAPARTPAKVFESAPGTEAWCIRGFKQRAAGLLCSPHAEMLLRAPDGVTLRVAAGSPRARLRIRNGAGEVLRDGAVSPGEQIRIPGAALGGLLLRFDADRPVMFADIRRGAPDPLHASSRLSEETRSPVHLHTNGCGDFTLMARSHWFDLRGYPELDAFSMNIDSVLCWAAHHGGAREEVLAARIFHIEHGSGSGWTPEGEQKLYQRIMAKGLPWLDFRTVLDWAGAMNRFDVPLIFNRENWGLENETLPETNPFLNACGQGNG